jgi:hypothetical protein
MPLALTGPEGPYSVQLRLRESNVLELQQRLLSDMGRVGLISKMPFTFPVEVLLFTTGVDGNPRALELPITSSDGGVCITGRDEKGNDVTRLILTEASVDEILSAIPKIDEGLVHTRTRETLKRLQSSAAFRSLLQRGLKAPAANTRGNLVPLKVAAEKKEGDETVREEVVGLIARNPVEPLSLPSNAQKSGAIIIILKDLEGYSIADLAGAAEGADSLPPATELDTGEDGGSPRADLP